MSDEPKPYAEALDRAALNAIEDLLSIVGDTTAARHDRTRAARLILDAQHNHNYFLDNQADRELRRAKGAAGGTAGGE